MNDQRGQTLVEYALILALVAIMAILALVFLGDQLAAIFRSITDAIPGN